MADYVPLGWHTVTPRLIVHDPAGLVEFIREAFGATGEFGTERPSEVRIGDSVVMVSGVGPREPMPACLYLYVEDADMAYRTAVGLGAVSLEEPREVPYGDRRAMVKDPWGNVWQIATRK